MTVLDVLVRYSDEQLAGLSPLTVSTRQGVLLRFARYLEPRSLLEATTGDIAEWFDSRALAASTRSNGISTLHRFYNWCLNDGLVDRDPAAPLIRLKQPLTAGELPGLERGWAIAQERKALSRSTIVKRALELRTFSDWIAPKPLMDATAADVELWLDARGHSGKPLGAKARYAAISNLHMFFKWAAREGLCEKDPTEHIDRPRLSQNVPRPIRTDDLARALEAADATTAAVMALAAFCGLRAKEIAGLRREDLLEHLDEPMLIVTAPKGRRQRTVPLHPAAWRAVQPLTHRRRSGPLFCWDDGKVYPGWKVSHLANDHLHSLGIASSLHKLRHWYATEVYGASLDLRLTQELLGHSSPTTTAIYAAYNKAKASAVVNQLSAPMTAKHGPATTTGVLS